MSHNDTRMKKLFIFVLFLLFFTGAPLVFSVSAASFSFDPVTVKATKGVPFQVKLNIDTGTDEITSADAFIKFDKTILKATDVTDGTFFAAIFKEIKTDMVYAAGMVEDQTQPVKGTGLVATITFEPLVDGTATITIDCTSSKILKTDNQSLERPNIIVCASNGTSAVTVGAGSSSNPAPTSSSNPAPSSSSKPPSELPKSGILENVMGIAIPGAILILIGSVVRVLL